MNATANLDGPSSAAEYLASRRFTRIVLAIVLGGVALSVGFALLVDPLRTFGTGRIPSVLTSEHYSKPASFLELPGPPQAIVLGTSRVMKLNPACIEELTGYSTFNFGLSSSHVEDWAAAYRFARERGKAPIRELIIGVDVEAFDNHAEPDPRLLSSSYLRPYLDTSSSVSSGTAARALFGWQALRFGFSSLWYHLHPSSRPAARMRFDAEGFAHYDQWETAMQDGTLDRRPLFAAVADKFRGPLSGKRFDALSSDRVARFKQLARSAHADGATVHVFVPPLHPQLAAILTGPIRVRSAERDALLAELEHEGTVRFLRITRIEDVHGDPSGYFDGVHMTEANSSRLLLAMFHREHGCGQ